MLQWECTCKQGWPFSRFFFLFQLMKEFPLMSVLNIHENLIEALLEMQSYSEVQVNVLTDWLTDPPTDRLTDRLTDRPTDRQTDRQNTRQEGTYICRQPAKHQTDRETVSQNNMQTDIHVHIKLDKRLWTVGQAHRHTCQGSPTK